MAGGSLNEGMGRCLPQWMLGVSIAEQVKQVKPDHVKERDKHQEEVLVSEGTQSETKAMTRRPRKGRVLHKEEKLLDDPQLPIKCETKIRKRKSKQEDTGADSKIPESVPEKNYNVISKTNRQSVSWKGKKAADCSLGSNEELELQPLSDDVVELTVEDMIFIAEEHVRADKDVEHKEASNRQHESKSRLPSTSTSRNTLEDFDDSNHIQTLSNHNVSTSFNSQSGLMSEKLIVAGDGNGDPAHVMLDLFLGRLLRKPSVDEKTREFNKEDSSFARELDIQSQNKIAGELIVPPTKKKSSLKDKVTSMESDGGDDDPDREAL